MIPTFKSVDETPIEPVCISLLELPWHFYYKEILTDMLAPICKVLYLDNATVNKTRGRMARVRIQLDLTKDRPKHVCLCYDEENLSKGKLKSIEYENLPAYCPYCKHQGHMMEECTVKLRDEELYKVKELEAA